MVREDGLYYFTYFHPNKSYFHPYFNFSCNNHIVVSSSVASQQNNCNSPYMLWHLRLGQPHSVIVQSILKTCNISCGNKSKFYSSCAVAKAHILPSFPSQTIYTKPLELLFMDVWGPSPVKSCYGLSYYLSIVYA